MNPFSDPQIDMLEDQLDPGLIHQRKAGRDGSVPYLEGFEILFQANRIFGFGNWGYEAAPPYVIGNGNRVEFSTGKITGGWELWACQVRVTVRGENGECITVTDVGTCTRDGLESDASLDMAVKGAVTDGIKRALRAYGNQFGLSLYDKPDRGVTGTARPPEGTPRPQSKWVDPQEVSKIAQDARRSAQPSLVEELPPQTHPMRQLVVEALNSALSTGKFQRRDIVSAIGSSEVNTCLAWVNDHQGSIDSLLYICEEAAKKRLTPKEEKYE